MKRITLSDAGTARAHMAALARSLAPGADVSAVVSELLAHIQAEGDAAAVRLTERFDGARLLPDQIRVEPEALSAAALALPAKQYQWIQSAIEAVRDFHERTRPEDWVQANVHGGEVGERFFPIQRVGCYIPGGQVPLVSSVLMTTVPASVAGCPEVAVCTPPRPDGSVAPALLAALHLCGVQEVYRLGGVQAIGAMGYGTATIPAVDKLFGPGNAYVNEAKRQLYGTVGVDLLPGPSEVLIIADQTSTPAFVAADLLAQAEHGTGKEKLYLIALPGTDVDAVLNQLEQQAMGLAHAAAIQKVLDERFILAEAPDLPTAAAAANGIAPEHMELQVSEAAIEYFLGSITTAGAFLLGHHTPTVLGDFTAGPSHTLPTDTTARFSSGIQVSDFMRRSSLVRYSPQAAMKAWPVVEGFSQMEALDAHGASLKCRLPQT
jgi:histidinol dehydrogenase